MNDKIKHNGSCFCGDVEFSLTGEPEAMAYCHCDSCRHWSAGPVSAFTLWKPENIHVTRGLNNIAAFDKNPGSNDETVVSIRQWCKTCGGHLYTDHPTMGLIDVPSAVINNFAFKPAFHVHYQETVQPMQDGLPKFKDLPAEAGGTGEELAE
ncbi:MAG: GFA family protein [Gammaproteobacteria bacterium]